MGMGALDPAKVVTFTFLSYLGNNLWSKQSEYFRLGSPQADTEMKFLCTWFAKQLILEELERLGKVG